jgi:hypothetical protein
LIFAIKNNILIINQFQMIFNQFRIGKLFHFRSKFQKLLSIPP